MPMESSSDHNKETEDRILISEWPIQSESDAVGCCTAPAGNEIITSAQRETQSKILFYQDVSCSALNQEKSSLSFLKRKRQELKSQCDSPFKKNCESRETVKDAELKEPLASVRVAKWWRKKKHLGTNLDISSKNPNTILYHISRQKECQDFLKEERKMLKRKILLHSRKEAADIYASLASIEDWLGLYESSLENITKAVELWSSNSEFLWLKEKLCKQIEAHIIQQDMMEKYAKCDKVFPSPEKVERVSCKKLSVEDFKNNFVKRQKPVIIEDLVCDMTKNEWSLSYIKSKAGTLKAPVKKSLPESTEWAKLEEDKVMSVAEHIDSVEKGESSNYLFDWSLPLHCPELAGEIKLPAFFSDNFLTQTEPGSLYRDSWPSLFVAPANVISDLHVDAFASSFWMALFQGEKRWTLFDHSDVPLLYPKYQQSLDPSFNVNIAKPNLDLYPLLALTKPKQCILKPGDLLFVPAGCPHFVENLSASVAVSSNYVDATNYHKVCEELRINGLLDPRAAQLFSQLQTPEFKRRVQLEGVGGDQSN